MAYDLFICCLGRGGDLQWAPNPTLFTFFGGGPQSLWALLPCGWVSYSNASFFPHSAAVADDATRGIVELVAKQRSAKKAPAQRGGVGFFSPRYQHHNPMVLPRRGYAPPALPAQLRAQLHQLLSHGAVGLSELETAFARRFGFPLRVNNYGFYSIAEMLAAAADLVAVTQSRMGSQLSLRGAVVASRMRTGPIKPLFPLKQTIQTVPIVRQMTQTNSGWLVPQ